MKKSQIILFFLAVLVPLMASAGSITEEQALHKAQQFMTNKTFTTAKSRQMAPACGTDAALYVFNAQEGGFAIVSGNDRTDPIVGYSDTGSMDMDNLPAHIQSWMDGYAEQIAYLQEHPDAPVVRKTVSGSAITPLLGAVQWDQDSPYNDLCPTDGGRRSMTGCLATAMAQVMYFHQSPSQTINVIPGYTTTSRKTDVNAIPAGTSIDWAYILPTYKTSTGSETEAQRYAVAKLMLLCGTSVKMDYTAAASAAATTEASAALKSVFNYDATTRRVVRLDYKQEEWNQMIYDELAQRRPVLYNGTTATGAGHAFVIDGYDKNDYFHVNWGWSGDCNGFFRLSMLSPTDPGQSEFTNVGFNLSQDAIIGIQKNTYNPITLKLTAAGADIYSDLSRMTRSSSGENFELYHYFTYYFDNDVSQATFECAVGIYNTVGSLLSVVTNIETGDFASLDKKSFSRAANFGANLSNGTYTLKPIYRKKGELAWKACLRSDVYNIRATISGNNLTAEAVKPVTVTKDLSATITPTGDVTANIKVPFSVTVTNTGDDFNSEVYFTVDDVPQGGCILEIAKGQTKTLQFAFTPTEPGRKTVSLAYKTFSFSALNWVYNPISSISIDVPEPPTVNLSLGIEATNSVNGIVNAESVNVRLTVANVGTAYYTGKAKVQVMKVTSSWTYDYSAEMVDLQVSVGQTVIKDLAINNLEDGDYVLIPYYQKDDNWVMGSSTCVVTFRKNDNTQNYAYAVYNSNTLTFYYDALRNSRQGTVYEMNQGSNIPDWSENCEQITTAVFDISFADTRPYTTASWFNGCTALTEIVGLDRLNTSRTTNMERMFYRCVSLKRLTLSSNFVSTDATDCSDMFTFCHALSIVTFTGNVPANLNSQLFAGLGTASNPLTLDVPDQYRSNYAARFSNGTFYGGYFRLNGNETPDDNIITFDDATVKAYCIKNWDTNNSGELSVEEAAAVKSLGTVFNDKRTITSFNELKYFTGLTAIEDNAFNGCSALTSIVIPTNVITIGKYAFGNCSGLTSISIPTRVTTIGEYAFYGCNGLSAISIPYFVNSLSATAFTYCSNLTSIRVESGNLVYDSRNNCNAIIKTSTNELMIGCQSTVIPSTIKSIGENAFYYCNGLTSIDIPGSVTSIGKKAFSGCGSLTSVTMSDGIATIDEDAFSSCGRLTTVTIPNSVRTIGKWAFYYCTGLKEVHSMIQNPFAIADNVFQYWGGSGTMFTSATLIVPNGTKTKYQTTEGWKNFSKIVEEGSVVVSEDIVFADANVKAVCVQRWDTNNDGELSEDEAAAVTDLGSVFRGNQTIDTFDELAYFTGLTTIAQNAFYGTSLSRVTIPQSVTSIASGAFDMCTNLAYITMTGTSPATIASNAFYAGSYAVSILYTPNDAVTTYQSANGWKQFANIVRVETKGQSGIGTLFVGKTSRYQLMTFKVTGTSPATCQIGNGQTVSVYNESASDVSLNGTSVNGYTVTAIGNRAFAGCNKMSRFTLPETIERIGDEAFTDCSSLSTLNIPKKVSYISASAFNDTNVTLNSPAMIAHIMPANVNVNILAPEEADELAYIQQVNIAKNVKSIEARTYSYAHYVRTMTVEQENTIYDSRDGSNAIIETATNTLLFGCQNTKIPATVTAIAAYAFEGHSSLTQLNLPQSLSSIGEYAFNECNSLEDIYSDITTPFTFDSNAFTWTTYQSATLHIPAGTRAKYEGTDGWSNFRNVVEEGTIVVEEGIAFADPTVKRLCVLNWDKNGDGELSEAEAAAVTDLGMVFNGSNIISFNELRYFTGLTTIGSRAFQNCTNLTAFTLPATVTTFGVNAFTGCTSLTSLAIPNTVTAVGSYAFQGCTGITDITIPNSVTSLGYYAFYNCKGLKEVHSLIEQPFAINTSVFMVYEEAVSFTSATLFVPAGTKTIYQNTTGWKNFLNIVETGTVVPVKGDVSGDGEVNGTDLVALANIIMRGSGSFPANADVNGDGEVNGTDLVALANIIMAPAASQESDEEESDVFMSGKRNPVITNVTIDAETLTMKSDGSRELAITLHNPQMDVTMVQIDVTLPKGLTLCSDDDDCVTTIGRTAWGTHQLYSGFVGDSTVRLLLASNTNELIEGSEGAILRLSLTAGTDFEGGDIVFRRMLCTSPDLTEARPATFTLHLNGTTGIGDNKRVTINSTRDVYDLQGRRVSEFGIRNSELKNGISIIGGRKVIK